MPSTLNSDQSLGSPLAATPKLSRPWARWSSIATRLASSAGWWKGIRNPPGPMRMRLVCSSAWATRKSGEGCGSQGRGVVLADPGFAEAELVPPTAAAGDPTGGTGFESPRVAVVPVTDDAARLWALWVGQQGGEASF